MASPRREELDEGGLALDGSVVRVRRQLEGAMRHPKEGDEQRRSSFGTIETQTPPHPAPDCFEPKAPESLAS